MKILKNALLVIIISMSVSIVIVSVINAYPINVSWFNQDAQTGKGYGDVILGGISASDKASFISDVKAHLYGTKSYATSYDRTRAATGAAFIIQTMRGDDDHSLPDLADVTNWEAKINNSQVTMDLEYYTYEENSGYTGDTSAGASGQNDDAYYYMPDTRESYVFRQNGVIVYVLKKNCGNPIGGLPGIIIPWTITPSASVVPSAMPGQTVFWTHKIVNNGPEKTNKTVNFRYENKPGFPSGSGPFFPNKMNSGSAAGTTLTNISSYVVQTSDLGKTLCRSTVAVPGGKNDSPPSVESDPACVTIAAVATTNNCRPFLITVRDPNWGSSTGIDGESVDVTVYVYKETGQNTNTYSSSPTKTYHVQNLGQVDLTRDLTTGDRYKVSYKTGQYAYDAEYDGYGNLEYYMYTHDEWTYPSSKHPGSQPIGPCFDYSLTSSINNLGEYRVEVNSRVTDITPHLVSASWTQTGLPAFYNTYLSGGLSTPLHTKTKKSKWQISQLIVDPKIDVPNIPNASDPAEPCTYYKSKPGIKDCKSIYGSSSSDTIFKIDGSFLSGNNPLVAHTDDIPDLPAGSKVCYTFSVYASTSDPKNNSFDFGSSDKWNHSAVSPDQNKTCVIVVKKPKVQVKGGDLSAGNKDNTDSVVYTTISVKTFGVFGSWSEYGILAPKSVTGMASGAAFANPTLVTDANRVCDYSALTFTNAGLAFCNGSTQKGYYVKKTSVPNAKVKASFSGNGIPVPATIGNLSTFFGEGFHIGTAGNLTLTGSQINKGHSIILKATGKVTITGNLTYEDTTYTGISQLPQLVIIADGGIDISSSVGKIDAWLVTAGTINTCHEGGDPDQELMIDDCNQQLVVNGPVMANKLYLRRTAGSEIGPDEASGSGMPAEIFNLRADSILWAFSRSTESGKVQTVYTTELPPRF